jgi:hypothetical protein
MIKLKSNTKVARRMIGRATTAGITIAQDAQIELLDHLDHEARQVLFWKPILNTRRHQEHRVAIERTKVA